MLHVEVLKIQAKTFKQQPHKSEIPRLSEGSIMGLSQISSAKEVYKGCILEHEAITADHLLLKCFQTQ